MLETTKRLLRRVIRTHRYRSKWETRKEKIFFRNKQRARCLPSQPSIKYTPAKQLKVLFRILKDPFAFENIFLNRLFLRCKSNSTQKCYMSPAPKYESVVAGRDRYSSGEDLWTVRAAVWMYRIWASLFLMQKMRNRLRHSAATVETQLQRWGHKNDTSYSSIASGQCFK